MFWGGPALLGVDRSQSPGHGEGTEAGPCRRVLTQGPCLWGNKLPWKVSREVESSGLKEGGAAGVLEEAEALPSPPHPQPLPRAAPLPQVRPLWACPPQPPAACRGPPTCLPRAGAAW